MKRFRFPARKLVAVLVILALLSVILAGIGSARRQIRGENLLSDPVESGREEAYVLVYVRRHDPNAMMEVDAVTVLEEYRYDENGWLGQKLAYGEYKETTEYEYDENGNRIRESVDGRYMDMDYQYDAAGRLILESRMNGRHETYHCEYTYDENGLLIETAGFELGDPGTLLDVSYNYVLDSEGRVIARYHDGYPQMTWGYDSCGRLIRETKYGYRYTVSERTLYEYDRVGNLVKTSHYMRGILQDYTIFEYNNDLCTVERDYTKNTRSGSFFLCRYKTMDYDENGRLTRLTEIQGSGPARSKSTTGYVYDELGNLTQVHNYTYDWSVYNQNGEETWVESSHETSWDEYVYLYVSSLTVYERSSWWLF